MHHQRTRRGRWVMAVVLTIAIVAGAWHGGALARQDETLQIPFITINMQNQFFVELNEGAQAAATALGAEAILFDPNGEAIEQVNAIETYVQQGVDAIIVDAIDAEGIIPALQQAEEAGIPIVAVDAVVDDPVIDAQVGTDNEDAGFQIGEFCVNSIEESLGGQAQVGVILARQSQLQQLRARGFTAALEGHDGIEVVQEVDGGYAPDTSLTAAENLLTANPDLAVIYATGEPAVLGAMAAAESQNRSDMKICGWDLTAEIAEGIEQGVVLGVVRQDPVAFGRAAMETAVTLAQGESVEQEVAVPITIVTQENLAQFMGGDATPIPEA